MDAVSKLPVFIQKKAVLNRSREASGLFCCKVVCDVFVRYLGMYTGWPFRSRKKTTFICKKHVHSIATWIQIHISDGCKLYCAHRDIEYNLQPMVAWWLRFVVYYCRHIPKVTVPGFLTIINQPPHSSLKLSIELLIQKGNRSQLSTSDMYHISYKTSPYPQGTSTILVAKVGGIWTQFPARFPWRPSGQIGRDLCRAPERFGSRNCLPASLGFLGRDELGWVGVLTKRQLDFFWTSPKKLRHVEIVLGDLVLFGIETENWV